MDSNSLHEEISLEMPDIRTVIFARRSNIESPFNELGEERLDEYHRSTPGQFRIPRGIPRYSG
jgi:hypothetical protein